MSKHRNYAETCGVVGNNKMKGYAFTDIFFNR